MFKLILKIFLILGLVIFQIGIMTKFSVLGAIPNLILIIAIALILRGRWQDGILVASLGGLLLDLASPLRFGIYTFSFLIVVLFINFFLLQYSPTPNLIISFLIFTASFLFVDLIIFLFIKTWPPWEILFQAGINGFWGMLIYKGFESLIKPREEIIT